MVYFRIIISSRIDVSIFSRIYITLFCSHLAEYISSKSHDRLYRIIFVSVLKLFIGFVKLMYLLQADWPEGYILAKAMNFKFPQFSPMNLSSIVTNASSEAIKLMSDMMQWNPTKRPTAQQCFKLVHGIHVPICLSSAV